jgi:hypothetical protein
MTRALYASMLRLHPRAFRRQFAAEMLWIFDEARVSEGAFLLLLDLLISVSRQWLLRSGLWKVMLALAGATFQVASALWMGSRPRHLPIPSTPGAPLPMEAFVAITSCLVTFIASMVIASVFWFRRARTRA